jgi:FkbM family methyltransferase
MYTQNDEEFYILGYFKDFVGTCCEIGANDGKYISNTAALIDRGWKSFMVEPSKAFNKLKDNYADNPNVVCVNAGISTKDEDVVFYEGSDSLLSTTQEKLVEFWKECTFTPTTVKMLTWKTFCDTYNAGPFDFISLDAEGMDWDILQQIDLSNTSMICMEYTAGNIQSFESYCKKYGMVKLTHNGENLIMIRPKKNE